MRVFYTTLTILNCLAGSAMALETAAGADTVNDSQVGINAKIDASNQMLQTAIDQIANCGVSNSIFKPGSGCEPVLTTESDPVATPKLNNIFACSDANKIAHSNGSCSAALPPDVSTQVNNIIACNAQGKFFNGTTCAAPSGTGGTPVPDMTQCGDWPQGNKGVPTYCPAGRVMVGVTSYDIETGPKKWDARFICCALKMQ